MRLWKLFGGPPIKVIKVDGEKQSWKYQYTEKVESFSAGFCLKIHWADKNVDKRKYIFNMFSSFATVSNWFSRSWNHSNKQNTIRET